MESKNNYYFYNIDCPTIGELLFEDNMFWYLKPLSRKSSFIDRINKHQDKIFTDAGLLLDYSNSFCDNEIRKAEEKRKNLEKFKNERHNLIKKLTNLNIEDII